MQIAVALRIPFQKPYTYSVPQELQNSIVQGVRVLVPLRNKKEWGVVVEILSEPQPSKYKILPIFAVIDSEPVYNAEMLKFAKWIADYYLSSWGEVLNTALPGGLTPQISKIRNTENQTGTIPLRIKEKKTQFLRLLSFPALPEKKRKREKILDFLKEKEGVCEKSVLHRVFPHASPVLKKLLEEKIIEQFEEKVTEEIFLQNFPLSEPEFEMTPEQFSAFEKVKVSIREKKYCAFLLFGVTGSGKTEIYVRIAEFLTKEQKSSLILVPEIALTNQTLAFFRKRLGNRVFISHSGLSDRERVFQWKQIRKSEFCTVIGTRSAIFSPIQKLGCIIVDEEHDSSYKQEETPFYHSRDLSVKLANNKNIPVILGSATPSVESFANAKAGKYELLELKSRTGNAELPDVRVIDMNTANRSPRYSYISAEFIEAVEQTLAKKLQVLLFLNRRGFDTRIECGDCLKTLLCKNCNLPYTWHKADQTIVCHICKIALPNFSACPFCKGRKLKHFGIGIQKVEEHFRLLFPGIRILRFDSDTVSKKTDLEKALQKIRNGETDLIVGTKMISKGHDFRKIGFVGVLGVDSMLNILHFRASERAYQMISQVSGRGGRSGNFPGATCVQTYNPQHLILQTARKNDYSAFFEYEIEKRILCNDPPICKTIRLLISHLHETRCIKAVKQISEFLTKNLPPQVQIEGPTEWSIYRIKRRFYWQILLKSESRFLLKESLRSFLQHGQLQKFAGAGRISVNVDP